MTGNCKHKAILPTNLRHKTDHEVLDRLAAFFSSFPGAERREGVFCSGVRDDFGSFFLRHLLLVTVKTEELVN